MLLRGCSTLLFSILSLFSIAGSSTAINLLEGEIQSYTDSLKAEFDKNPSEFTEIVYPPLCLNKPEKSKFICQKC